MNNDQSFEIRENVFTYTPGASRGLWIQMGLHAAVAVQETNLKPIQYNT